MTEIDTAAEREAANELIESGEATGQDFADVVPELLDAYDRLRAENRILRSERDEAQSIIYNAIMKPEGGN